MTTSNEVIEDETGIKSSGPARPGKLGRPPTSSKITVGVHGEEALEVLYRLGGATATQLGRLIGIDRRQAAAILKTLERSRLCEIAAVKAWWHSSSGRPEYFYFLSSRDSNRGVVYGGFVAGEETGRKAIASYKLCQLPARAAHASLRNEFYLRLRGDAEAREGEEVAEVLAEELWAEAHPDFPLLDEGRQVSARKNARKAHGRVYPDGCFTVRFEKELECRYLLEVETQSRSRKLLGKVDGYGSHLARRLKEDEGSVARWLSPVVLLFRQNSTRDTAVENVSEAISSNAPELKRYLAWEKRARNRGVEAGRLLLFGSLEDLEGDSLGMRYRALTAYPEDAPGVSKDGLTVELEAAAEEVDEVRGGQS